MSEVQPKPTEYDELTWGEGATPNTHTKPSAARLENGWPFEGLHPHDEENWVNRAMSRIVKWLGDAYVREFSTLAEGVAAVASPRSFRVHPPAAGLNARNAQVFSAEGGGGAVAVTAVCTDGRQIYYAQGDTVYASSPASLTTEWSYTPAAGINVVDLWTDGRWVYALLAYSASEEEINLLDTADPATTHYSTELASPSGVAIRANGVYLTVLQGNYCRVYDSLSGAPNYLGQYDHGAALAGLAMDATRAYIGGAQGTGSFDVRAITLSTQAAAWSVALPFSSAPTVNCIATDGEYVYVGTNWAALSGGGNANLLCLSVFDGTVVWTLDTSVNTTRVCVDDRFVYHATSTGNMFISDKRNGIEIEYLTSFSVRDCDGVSCCGASTNNVHRRWRGNASRTFQRAAGADPNRRPFHKLALPLDAGL